jgi:hypothetical protein
MEFLQAQQNSYAKNLFNCYLSNIKNVKIKKIISTIICQIIANEQYLIN